MLKLAVGEIEETRDAPKGPPALLPATITAYSMSEVMLLGIRYKSIDDFL